MPELDRNFYCSTRSWRYFLLNEALVLLLHYMLWALVAPLCKVQWIPPLCIGMHWPSSGRKWGFFRIVRELGTWKSLLSSCSTLQRPGNSTRQVNDRSHRHCFRSRLKHTTYPTLWLPQTVPLSLLGEHTRYQLTTRAARSAAKLQEGGALTVLVTCWINTDLMFFWSIFVCFSFFVRFRYSTCPDLGWSRIAWYPMLETVGPK